MVHINRKSIDIKHHYIYCERMLSLCFVIVLKGKPFTLLDSIVQGKRQFGFLTLSVTVLKYIRRCKDE